MRTLACHSGGCTPSNNFSLNISLLLDIALQWRHLRKHLKRHLDCFSTFSFSFTARLLFEEMSFVDCNFSHYVNNKRESKMSESEIESNSLLKCDVCLIDYGQSHKQKFLPCLHSFCQSCLTEIQQADGGIKCPVCRELHVDSRDVSSLPSNYFEALKKMEKEKNEIISLYAKNDKIQSAYIGQLKRRLALESKRIAQLELLAENDGKSLTLLKELHDQKSEKIEELMCFLSVEEKVMRLLKERVAILEKAQN